MDTDRKRRHQMGLERKPCAKCGAEAQEVINAGEQVRRGWYCPTCKHYDVALGRERKI